jgi:hypothetical protein
MLKEEDISQIKQSLAIENFETFEPDVQLAIIRRLETTVSHLRAIEDDFPPKHMEELLEFFNMRIDEMQIIYNMRTNRRLDEFLG